MYKKGKTRSVETILRMVGGGDKGELIEGVNLTGIYCKNFCKCHSMIIKRFKEN
jgi:hypothetical protein